MRDLLLLMAFTVMMAPAAVMPHVGVLVWSWLAIMQPHREAFGFSFGFQFNLIAALATMGFWFFSREPKRLPLNGLTILLLLFAIWMVVCTFSGFSPNRSTAILDRNLKTLLLAFVIAGLMTSRARIHALVLVMAISVAFYGVKGGGFVLLGGAGSKVVGPEGSHIFDRNHLATALVMTLPLLNYLREYSAHKLVRLGLLASMGATLIATLGTLSRGGFLALGAMLLIFWWRSNRKLMTIFLIAPFGFVGLALMPESFYQRMETIKSADEDASFSGRLDAWQMSINLANDRPIVGAGFEGYMDPAVFFRYNPDATIPRAIHSIYFQVLAEMGYIGLFLFLAIGALGVRYCFRLVQAGKRDPSLKWAGDLGSAFVASFAGFAVGGAALSLAYYDLYYCMIAVLCRLRAMVAEAEAPARLGARVASLSAQAGSRS